MNIESLFMILFLLGMLLFVYVKRKNIEIHKIFFPLLYFALYKTKLGLKFMNRVARKWPKTLKYTGYFAVFIGFLGMILIAIQLVSNVITIFTQPEAAPGVGIVLPIEAKGVFYVPFFYWIIAIFIIAVVHEFSHGIIARLYDVRIKSSGFAFLGIVVPIIPAAFVEQDDKQMKKKQKRKQLSIFAAGPFANIALGFVFLLLLAAIFAPLARNIEEYDGVEIAGLVEAEEPLAAESAGISEGEIITQIDDISVKTLINFSHLLDSKNPGDMLLLQTDKKTYELSLSANPENKSQAYIGVYVSQHKKIKDSVKEKYGYLPDAFLWFYGLFSWLFLLNIGIGLFNLVPIGPLDGGRMLQLVLKSVFNEKRGEKIWKVVSLVFFTIVLIIIIHAFIR